MSGEQPDYIGQYQLSGPTKGRDPLRTPVRGDLAHIALAGHCFVPHYAVPMPHTLVAAAQLRKSARDDGEALAPIAKGNLFDVLDISGGWAWGQVGADGLVGYLPLGVLVAQ